MLLHTFSAVLKLTLVPLLRVCVLAPTVLYDLCLVSGPWASATCVMRVDVFSRWSATDHTVVEDKISNPAL